MGVAAGILPRVLKHARNSGENLFWAVRLSAERDNLLAAWSWAIGAGNVDTAFQMLVGFAPRRGQDRLSARAAGEASGPEAARCD